MKLKLFLSIMLLVLSLQLFGTEGLFINEFMANNSSVHSDEIGEFDDWIEIYNSNTYDLNLNGLFLSDDPEVPNKWEFPNISIDSEGFLLFWADSETEQGELHTNFKLDSGGEFLGIFDYDGLAAIDSLSFGQQYNNISFGRFPNGEDSWSHFATPTPNASNNAEEPVTGICINEFMASNLTTISDEFDEFNDWIEVFNAGDEPVDIGGLFFTDNLANPGNWQIPTFDPDATTINPGDYLILWADNDTGQGILHLGFQLDILGEAIGIYNGVTPIDTVTFIEQQTDISYGRIPDGLDIWQTFPLATPGVSNLLSGHNYGDVNDDGEVTFDDAELVMQFIVEEVADFEDWQMFVADVDADGQLMAYDAALIWQTAEGLIAEFPIENNDRDLIDSEITIIRENNTLSFFTTDLQQIWDVFSYQFNLEVNSAAADFSVENTLSENAVVVMNQTNELKICCISLVPLSEEGNLVNVTMNSEPTMFSLNNFYYNTSEINTIIGNVAAENEELQLITNVLNNYPNPFNPVTTITFETINSHENMRIEIYNIKGQIIDTIPVILSGVEGSVICNAENFASGIYFYKLNIPDSPIKKMVLLK